MRLEISISETDKKRLESLCKAMGLSCQRGKSAAICRLINRAKVEGTTVDLDELPNKESLEYLRKEFARMARVGGNLNQLVRLLEIKKIRLDTGENDKLDVDADFLVAILQELNKEVDNIKAAIKTFTRKY